MNTLPTVCPFCSGELYVTHMYCRECDTNIEGRFVAGVFAQLRPEQIAFVENFVTLLAPEQLEFVEIFVRCEGKIKSMEAEMGLSYPTIRNRLNEVIESLGYEPGGDDDESQEFLEAKRLGILEDLDSGQIDAAQAMRMLQESEI